MLTLLAAERERVICLRTRRTTEAKIDAPGVERFERAELFRDDERGVVREHHPPDPTRILLGSSRDVGDDDRSRSAAYTGHVVVFRQPVTLIAQSLDMACKFPCVAQGIGRGLPLQHGNEIENGEFNHKVPIRQI